MRWIGTDVAPRVREVSGRRQTLPDEKVLARGKMCRAGRRTINRELRFYWTHAHSLAQWVETAIRRRISE